MRDEMLYEVTSSNLDYKFKIAHEITAQQAILKLSSRIDLGFCMIPIPRIVKNSNDNVTTITT
jgi:hypothetical protein